MQLENSTRQRWNKVIIGTLILALIAFIVMGYSGYFLFYNQVNANILNNYPSGDILANICRLLLCVNVAISVPYSCFMPRLSIFAVLTLFFGHLHHTFMHVCLTIFILVLGVILAILLNDLGVFLEIVGAVSAIGLAFILPPLLFLKLEKGNMLSPKKIVNLIILILGIVTSILSVIQTSLSAYNINLNI